MARDPLWDARAAQRIRDAGLHKHFTKSKKHYDEIAQATLKSLRDINEQPTLLKHDDLFDVLMPILERDAVTLQAFKKLGLPSGPGERFWNQWHHWFTHFVVEQTLDANQDDNHGDDKA